jgi:hypothetical protein
VRCGHGRCNARGGFAISELVRNLMDRRFGVRFEAVVRVDAVARAEAGAPQRASARSSAARRDAGSRHRHVLPRRSWRSASSNVGLCSATGGVGAGVGTIGCGTGWGAGGGSARVATRSGECADDRRRDKHRSRDRSPGPSRPMCRQPPSRRRYLGASAAASRGQRSGPRARGRSVLDWASPVLSRGRAQR